MDLFDFNAPRCFLLHGLSSVFLINGLDEGHIVHITTIGVLELGHNQLTGVDHNKIIMKVCIYNY